MPAELLPDEAAFEESPEDFEVASFLPEVEAESFLSEVESELELLLESLTADSFFALRRPVDRDPESFL